MYSIHYTVYMRLYSITKYNTVYLLLYSTCGLTPLFIPFMCIRGSVPENPDSALTSETVD